MATIVDQAKAQMAKSVESTKENFSGIRTGRANPALLNGITVDYYGAPTPLKAVATIGVPEPRTLAVTPFDASQANAVEKALRDSDLGASPRRDGNVIRLTMPELTEERRKEYVKIAKGKAESRDGKQQKQAEGNAYLAKQHPGTSLAQLRVGAVDQGAKDYIADAVQNLGSQHQRANDGAVQTQCSGQIKQYKAGNQTIGAVRGQITGTVGQLLIPFQIFFLCRCRCRHGNSPFKTCCIIHGDGMRLSLYIFSKALYNKAIGRTAFTECFCIVPIF